VIKPACTKIAEPAWMSKCVSAVLGLQQAARRIDPHAVLVQQHSCKHLQDLPDDHQLLCIPAGGALREQHGCPAACQLMGQRAGNAADLRHCLAVR
jgi:hypothetical protein